jgi:hypothetical protein
MKSMLDLKIAVSNPLDSLHWRPSFEVSTFKLAVSPERNFRRVCDTEAQGMLA